jgi:hypothetical protein
MGPYGPYYAWTYVPLPVEPGLENVCIECFIPAMRVVSLVRTLSILFKSKQNQSCDIPASGPTGNRGSPMDVPRGTNSSGTVNGLDYSGHAFDQMQGRGVPPSAVEEAIGNGASSPGNTPGTRVFSDSTNGVKVIVNSNSGRIITVITTGIK